MLCLSPQGFKANPELELANAFSVIHHRPPQPVFEVANCDLKASGPFFEVANCDLKESDSSFVSVNAA